MSLVEDRVHLSSARVKTSLYCSLLSETKGMSIDSAAHLTLLNSYEKLLVLATAVKESARQLAMEMVELYQFSPVFRMLIFHAGFLQIFQFFS